MVKERLRTVWFQNSLEQSTNVVYPDLSWNFAKHGEIKQKK